MFYCLVLCLSASEAIAQAGSVGPTLQWHANRAKSAGQTSYEFGPDQVGFDYTPKLTEIIKNNLLVDGLVESSFVEAPSNAFSIFTWYKIKVLSRGQEPSVSRMAVKNEIPEQLRMLGPDEIIVRAFGGTAIVDGVTLTVWGEPRLTIGKRYLFFLDSRLVYVPDSMSHQSAYDIGFMTRPLLVDEQGKIQHPSEKTTFLRSVEGFQDVDGLERYAQQVHQQQ
jgi:hypothetical protein